MINFTELKDMCNNAVFRVNHATLFVDDIGSSSGKGNGFLDSTKLES